MQNLISSFQERYEIKFKFFKEEKKTILTIFSVFQENCNEKAELIYLGLVESKICPHVKIKGFSMNYCDVNFQG